MKKMKWLVIFVIAALFYSCTTNEDDDAIYDRIMKFRNDYNNQNLAELRSNFYSGAADSTTLAYWDTKLGGGSQVTITIKDVNTLLLPLVTAKISSSNGVLDNDDITFTMQEESPGIWKIVTIGGGSVSFP